MNVRAFALHDCMLASSTNLYDSAWMIVYSRHEIEETHFSRVFQISTGCSALSMLISQALSNMRIPCRTSAKHRAQHGSNMCQTCPPDDAWCQPNMGAALQPTTSLQLPQTIWTEIQVWLWLIERAALKFTEFQKRHNTRGSILWPQPGLQHVLQFCPSKSSKTTDKRVTMTLDESSMQVYAFTCVCEHVMVLACADSKPSSRFA